VGLITGNRAKELIAHYSHSPHSSVARTAEALEQMDKKWPKKNPARHKSLIILGQNWDIYAEGGTRIFIPS
jgi:hypothetical protein